jgi:glycosyltransferase involved in cell wall biosynthesis
MSDGALRARLKTKGLARAQLFDWQHTARQTLEVYKKAANLQPV